MKDKPKPWECTISLEDLAERMIADAKAFADKPDNKDLSDKLGRDNLALMHLFQSAYIFSDFKPRQR